LFWGGGGIRNPQRGTKTLLSPPYLSPGGPPPPPPPLHPELTAAAFIDKPYAQKSCRPTI